MESIRNVATSVCVAMVVSGILAILTPGKSMERTIKIALGLFFLASIVLPFTRGDFSFAFDFANNPNLLENRALEQTATEDVMRLSEQNIEQIVLSTLLQQQIKPEKIDVLIHISEDRRITISKIHILIEKPKQQEQEQALVQEVSTLVMKTTGVKPTVEVAL